MSAHGAIRASPFYAKSERIVLRKLDDGNSRDDDQSWCSFMSPGLGPLVSIVTPAHNAAPFLEELLRSVEAQSYRRIEHIVIDDGSTDDGATRRILQQHPSVRWWSQPNRGQYATLNEGFRAATGDIITTISADDLYIDNGAVAAIADFFVAHPAIDVAHGYTVHVNHDGTPCRVQEYDDYPYWMLTYNLGAIPHCSLFVRRDRLLSDELLFDESLRYTGDGDWLGRIYLAGYRFGRVKRPIAAYRHHALQATTRAMADPEAFVRKQVEREMVDAKFRQKRLLRWFVRSYVSFHHRRLMFLVALRSGGLREVVALVRTRLRRGAR
jgi:glycosyltransferase involved in cell wall biosynthesis